MDSTTDVVLANPPDSKAITEAKQSAHALLEQAKGLVVENAEDFKIGGAIIIRCATATRALDGLMRPNIKRLDVAHKAAIAELKALTMPLTEARGYANGTMRAWERAEARKKAEAEAKLREAALKEEHARRDAQAEHMANIGQTEEAVELLDRPVAAPVVHIPSTVPKIAGQSVRKTWKARVVDAKLVPDQYKVVDMTGLNAMARSFKERAVCPGVEFYAEETTTQRSV